LKKLFAILVPLVFVLSACKGNDTTLNTISVVELTDRENAILSTTSDQSFVFDFNVDNHYEEVSVWIEKYESGKLVDDQISFMTSSVEESGTIVFANTNRDGNQKYPSFNLGVSSKGSTSSIRGFDPDPKDLDEMSSVWSHFQEASHSIVEGEVVLASICYSSGGMMSSLPTDFYKDVDHHIDELEKYDVVYLLKTEFKK
jgi:hypothetical protein